MSMRTNFDKNPSNVNVSFHPGRFSYKDTRILGYIRIWPAILWTYKLLHNKSFLVRYNRLKEDRFRCVQMLFSTNNFLRAKRRPCPYKLSVEKISRKSSIEKLSIRKPCNAKFTYCLLVLKKIILR